VTRISQINTPQGRKYETPVGLLPSVTTILQATMPLEQKQRLQRWRERQKKTTEDANTESEAANRGTKIHELIAAQLQGKPLDCPDELLEFWHPVRKVIVAISAPPVAIETPVYHPTLQYAGTPDLIASWQEQLTIFDWKTSYRMKQLSWMGDAAIQVAAYKAAFEQIAGIEIEQALVVVISPNRVQIFDIDVKQYWDEWLQRLQAYYSEQH